MFAHREGCQFLRDFLRTHPEHLLNLLQTVKCPACDDEGAIEDFYMDYGCCGRYINEKECCGDGVVVKMPELVPCDWCEERAQTLAIVKGTENEF